MGKLGRVVLYAYRRLLNPGKFCISLRHKHSLRDEHALFFVNSPRPVALSAALVLHATGVTLTMLDCCVSLFILPSVHMDLAASATIGFSLMMYVYVQHVSIHSYDMCVYVALSSLSLVCCQISRSSTCVLSYVTTKHPLRR